MDRLVRLGLIGLSAGCIVLTACITVKVDLFKGPGPPKEVVVSGEGDDKIVMIALSGIISTTPAKKLLGLSAGIGMVARIKEELDLARKDKAVKGLLVRVMSPGGTISASDIIYHLIREFKRKKKVPVVACLVSLATSGGYYVALAADEIVALPTTITGSIGVIIVKVNIAGLMKKIGVQDETYVSGPNKRIMSFFVRDSEKQRKIVQNMINAVHRRFVNLVAKRRNMPLDKAAKLADGRVFLAPEAKRLGLIDRLGYVESAVARIKKLAKLKKAKLVVYRRPGQYKKNLYAVGPMDPAALKAILPPWSAPHLLYLWGL